MQLKTAVKGVLHKGLEKQYKKQVHKQTISYEDYIEKLEKAYIDKLDEIPDYDESAVQAFL